MLHVLPNLVTLPANSFQIGLGRAWLIGRAKPYSDLGLAPLVLIKTIVMFRECLEKCRSYWKEFCRQRAGGGEQK